jgi:NitT/TauT family transport system substrate-binding protein
MSGQIDVGWAAPPFGLDQLDRKEIRIIATGNDADAFKGQTVRVNIVNANYLKAHKDVVDRYLKAYRETVAYMYTESSALKVYSDWLKISEAKAKRTRDDFFPRASVEPDKIVGLETIVKDAVTFKFTSAELTKAQVDDLIQIPPR